MIRTYSLEELPEIAGWILEHVHSGLILFHGEMGVGKTTLIKELAGKLGVTDVITSPTFSIVNEYILETQKIYHFDFYRIESEEEVLDIGIEDYFEMGSWLFVEWPEKVKRLLPDEGTSIEIIKNLNGSRTIKIMPVK